MVKDIWYKAVFLILNSSTLLQVYVTPEILKFTFFFGYTEIYKFLWSAEKQIKLKYRLMYGRVTKLLQEINISINIWIYIIPIKQYLNLQSK